VELRDDLAVQLDYRDPLEEAALELVVGIDVDLLELEVNPGGAQTRELLARLVAKMAVRPPVQTD
jgi:hypothetical protein